VGTDVGVGVDVLSSGEVRAKRWMLLSVDVDRNQGMEVPVASSVLAGVGDGEKFRCCQ
jgi:hypothetical protein